jgi:hypothetical protein
MICRYVFTNMWGETTEKSYRQKFGKFFDRFGYDCALIRYSCSGEYICVFVLDFVKKSGKYTCGWERFRVVRLIRCLRDCKGAAVALWMW